MVATQNISCPCSTDAVVEDNECSGGSNLICKEGDDEDSGEEGDVTGKHNEQTEEQERRYRGQERQLGRMALDQNVSWSTLSEIARKDLFIEGRKLMMKGKLNESRPRERHCQKREDDAEEEAFLAIEADNNLANSVMMEENEIREGLVSEEPVWRKRIRHAQKSASLWLA